MVLEDRLKEKLKTAKNVLVLATGGGNDSVSSLFLLRQLETDFDFKPDSITIATMLPDGVDYKDIGFVHPLIHEILPITSRWIEKKLIAAFPDPLLAEHAHDLGIERVVGLDMIHGSVGVSKALHHLIATEDYDTVIALDVGGDFIATKENTGVMSPMMDAYALVALKAAVASNPNVNFVFGIFGLGTDGESTPEMLDLALRKIPEIWQGTFTQSPGVNQAMQFYKEVIVPNRESRTASLVCRSIKGFPIHRFTHQYRNRFHTQPTSGDVRTYYTYFDHVFDEAHTGKYYLFDRIWDLENPYAFETKSSVEWFRGVQKFTDKLSHELNGESVVFIDSQKVFFGTPPIKFIGEDRKKIVGEIIDSVYNGVYPIVFMYSDDLEGLNLSGLTIKSEGKVALISQIPVEEKG